MRSLLPHFGATLLAIAFVLISALSFDAAAASPQQSVRSEGSYQLALRANDRVCCKRGRQDWWSTWRQCRRAGGHQTANRQCREDWNDRWDMRWWSWSSGNWNNRVCCKKGRRDWFTSARECRNAGGYQTANRACRRR